MKNVPAKLFYVKKAINIVNKNSKVYALYVYL